MQCNDGMKLDQETCKIYHGRRLEFRLLDENDKRGSFNGGFLNF